MIYFYWKQKLPKREEKKAYTRPAARKSANQKYKRRPGSTTDVKTVKQLLGELYADKEYLEKLLQETGTFLIVLFKFLLKFVHACSTLSNKYLRLE